MKKILFALLCVVIICATPFAVFAEDEAFSSGDTGTVVTENITTTEEIATEGKIEATEGVGTEAAFTVPTTEEIIRWAETNLKDVIVIVTILLSLVYQVRKHASLNKSVATCNNNAVAVVENSNSAIANALSEVAKVSAVVEGYKDKIDSLLEEIRLSDAEKKKLEAALIDTENYLNTAKLANIELSNEVAELLVLANIPNAKKEELYSRHRAAVNALDAVEKSAKHSEVKDNVGEKA